MIEKVKSISRAKIVLASGLLLIAASLLLATNYQLPTTYAQAAPCPSGETVLNGLVSAGSISSRFGNSTGTCVANPDTAPFRPSITSVLDFYSYEGMKKNYYTNAKAAKEPANSAQTTIRTLDMNRSNKVQNYTGADASGDITLPTTTYDTRSKAVFIIFIDNNLRITGNITSSSTNGLVLVAKKNVYIEEGVTRIDAVIISTGNIYTAVAASSGTSCLTSNVTTANPLIIRGSLISLGADPARIVFCRRLADNRTAAEQVISEPKYLILLSSLWSDTLERWAEVP